MVRGFPTFDLHGHGPGLLPEGSLLRSASTPADTPFESLKGYGLDACVLCAVGDPATFGFGSRNESGAVRIQVAKLRAGIEACHGTVLTSSGQLVGPEVRSAPRYAGAPGPVPETPALPAAGWHPGFDAPLLALLGVEGLDFLDGDLDLIDGLHASGLRLLGLVHYTPSAVGGICMDLRGDPAGPGTAGGLSEFGAAVIARANRLRMILDLTHANDATIFDAIGLSTRPVICSHTGPRSLCPTPRYLPDAVLRAISGSGGLVGLWPERMGAAGPVDLLDFIGMVARVVDVCGIDAVALGTDFNGVPGYAKGYRGPVDIGKIDEAMESRGFSRGERSAIMGGNAFRFISAELGA